MIDPNNNYSKMQKKFYSGGTSDHLEHNANPDYWNILLSSVSKTDNSMRKALDFGCGKGRNIENLQQFEFERTDGVDISPGNIEFCRNRFPQYKFYENNGVDLKDISDNTYDFVMSTIVFQHIPVYSIRFNLMQEIYRVMKTGGIFSMQMGFGNLRKEHAHYHNNFLEAVGTNGCADVEVVMPQDLIDDFTKIGFILDKIVISKAFIDYGHNYWIYITGVKRDEKI